jgi:hypothetical protein
MAHGDGVNAGHDLALGQATVAHQAIIRDATSSSLSD